MNTASLDPRRQAKYLYWQGWGINDISDHLSMKRATVSAWKSRDRWDDSSVVERIEGVAESRLIHLMLKPRKSGSDYKEMDAISRQLEKFARINKYLDGGNEVDLNPKLANRYDPQKRKSKNFLTDEQVEKLVEAFHSSLFEYQRNWFDNQDQRTRVILKSRQIGATWYFAREAIVNAYQTGRNKIFLSASKNQSLVFKEYIVQFVKDVTDVDLTGNPIVLPNGSHIYFLGTNSRTAQSYHGDFYFDEFFWTDKFETLNKVASAMAIHKKWRKTYFSTPSSKSHEAYPFWTGAKFEKRTGKSVPLDHNYLKSGLLCPDKIWRQIVTIYDAEEGGCDLFDIEHLRNYEYTEDQFNNLLLCEFIDDSKSVFSFSTLQKCMVDTWEVWSDFKPYLPRPFGNRRVWIGYDPSLTGDNAGMVVIAPPAQPNGKFRLLERHSFKNLDFAQQSEAIKKVSQRYLVEQIAIDATGIGVAVFQLVQDWFPAVVALNYSVELKTKLVLKAQNVIKNGRLEFDASFIDVVQSFLSIKKHMTPSGLQTTYNAGRTQSTGHADLAWATMNALLFEPLAGSNEQNKSIMELS